MLSPTFGLAHLQTRPPGSEAARGELGKWKSLHRIDHLAEKLRINSEPSQKQLLLATPR